MLNGQVVLTTSTVLALLRWQQAEPHSTLVTTPTWYSEEALRELDERARTELTRHGLAARGGVDPGLDRTMGIVARPAVEYYGWVSTTTRDGLLNYSVLAGAVGREGFVLARNADTDMVAINTVRSDDLLGAFVTQLPPVPAANGAAVSLPEHEYSGRRTRPNRGGVAVFDDPATLLGTVDKRVLDRILRLPRTGGGCLYAAERNSAGRRITVQHPLNYIDTTEGRWLTQLSTTRQERWITCAPATAQLVASRLHELRERIPRHTR